MTNQQVVALMAAQLMTVKDTDGLTPRYNPDEAVRDAVGLFVRTRAAIARHNSDVRQLEAADPDGGPYTDQCAEARGLILPQGEA